MDRSQYTQYRALVKATLRRTIDRKYLKQIHERLGLDEEELIAEGMAELIKAFNDHNPNGNAKPTSLAVTYCENKFRTILRTMKRHKRDHLIDYGPKKEEGEDQTPIIEKVPSLGEELVFRKLDVADKIDTLKKILTGAQYSLLSELIETGETIRGLATRSQDKNYVYKVWGSLSQRLQKHQQKETANEREKQMIMKNKIERRPFGPNDKFDPEKFEEKLIESVERHILNKMKADRDGAGVTSTKELQARLKKMQRKYAREAEREQVIPAMMERTAIFRKHWQKQRKLAGASVSAEWTPIWNELVVIDTIVRECRKQGIKSKDFVEAQFKKREHFSAEHRVPIFSSTLTNGFEIYRHMAEGIEDQREQEQVDEAAHTGYDPMEEARRVMGK